MPRQFTLGVLSPFLGGWYYGGIVNGIARAGWRLNANVVALQTLDAGTEQVELARAPSLRYRPTWDQISGFIVILRAANTAFLRAVQAAGKPLVVVGDEPAGLDCSLVLPDNRPGVRAAVAHLIGHGHRKIAFAGYLGATDVQERFEAYRDTMRTHGIEPDPALVFRAPDNHLTGGEVAGSRMIAAGVPSTAVVVGTDANAEGLMRVLRAHGLLVPQDQAIVGFDDQRVAPYSDPPLTTVRQPVELLGETAVAELVRLLRKEGGECRRHCLPTSLVVRESCGCLHTAWPDAAATTSPASRRMLTERMARAVSPVPGEATPDVTESVAMIADAIGADADVSPKRVRAALEHLAAVSNRPAVLMDLVNAVWAYGSAALGAAGPGADADDMRKASLAVESMMHTMLQVHGRAQFQDNDYLQKTLSQQYEVSTRLLRGHREDPRRLAWLARTPVRAGCLGLWTGDRRLGPDDAMLEVVGSFVRTAPPLRIQSPVRVAAFPPHHLVDLASERPDGVVFIVPVKAGTRDWGLLAVADSAERQVETAREPVNQWAALLAHTLDYDTVVRDLRKGKEQLRAAALFDSLTGLPNRRLFLDRLREAIDRDRRTPGRRFAVLFLDLDGFKVINDSLGHTAGDHVLVQVATRIRENLRDGDVAARFGGDEFLILLNGVDDARAATDVAERVQASLARPFQVNDQDVVVTASIGVTLSSGQPAEAEDLVRDADVAMYAAKSQIKGSHAVFDIAMRTRAVNRLRIETELRRAIECHEIETFFQPIVHMPTGRIYAFEALARWRHPSRGLVKPADFLPIAEETGLIAQIGQQILGESCRRLAAWRESTGQDLHVSVNVSHRQLWTGGLVAGLEDSLRACGLDGRCLALELTESVVMHNVTQARAVLEGIHDLGCELYIDDFGTGYSSLEALHQLPIDALKIDRSFISRLGADTKTGELVDSIVLMGHKLGLQLIAEGVETESQRERLLRVDCTYAQGHLFAPPIPADEAERLLLTSRPVPRARAEPPASTPTD
ncbi:MAG: EAL domain-containing protein [Hamadaea sp.]|nr:EAL domain-containing protein [Hamadaea sp.]